MIFAVALPDIGQLLLVHPFDVARSRARAAVLRMVGSLGSSACAVIGSRTAPIASTNAQDPIFINAPPFSRRLSMPGAKRKAIDLR